MSHFKEACNVESLCTKIEGVSQVNMGCTITVNDNKVQTVHSIWVIIINFTNCLSNSL